MEPRLIIAYSVMLAMAAFAASFVAYRIYYARGRSYRRRLRKEKRIHQGRQAPPSP